MKKQTQLIGAETDYAIRMLLHLAQNGHAAAAAISSAQSVPLEFAYKILRRLVKAGLVRSAAGRAGGFYPGMKPEQISLLTVMETVQGPLALRECLLDDASCAALPSCPVSAQLRIMQENLRQSLKSLTLDKVMQAKQGDSRGRK